MSVADLKADSPPCTLTQVTKPAPTVPDTGRRSSASPEDLARFIIEVPQSLIHKLIFWHCELRYTEKENVHEVLAALARLRRQPTINETEHGKVLAF